MKNVFYLLCVISIFCTSNLYANGYSGTKQISEIYAYKDGVRIKSSEGNWDNPDNCLNPSTLMIPIEHEAYDTLVSLTLAVQARGVPFRAYLNGCVTIGTSSYPKIWGVYSDTN